MSSTFELVVFDRTSITKRHENVVDLMLLENKNKPKGEGKVRDFLLL